MCDCKKTDGFKQKLVEAKTLTEQTGETHVVYSKEVPGQGKFAFMRKQSELSDALGICCYYLPDGTEVEFTTVETKKPKANKPKKGKNIEVVEPSDANETPSETATED